MKIYKYPLRFAQDILALTHVGARPVKFSMQNGRPTMWAEVDTSLPFENRVFAIFGTGHEIPSSASYIDTCLDGEFVWHLYELKQ